MAFGMQSYEEELAACKRSLFADLFQTPISSLLEVGIGTGPNFKYYSGHQVVRSSWTSHAVFAVEHLTWS